MLKDEQRKEGLFLNCILALENVKKAYRKTSFHLNNVSFAIPYGAIVGFIGENGAGKTTTMGTIIGTLQKDSGSVKLFGEEVDQNNTTLKEQIGVVFDEMNFSGKLDVKQLNQVFKRMYQAWDEPLFFDYIGRFSLPFDEKVEGFSRGMSMKLSLAVALSHDAKLLLLDEATAGLDPVAREEIIEELQTIVEDGNRSILLSSHITSDIEAIADELIFIKHGEIVLQVSSQDVKENYGMIRCTEDEMKILHKEIVVCTRKKNGLLEVIVNNKEKVPSTLGFTPHTLDDITVLLMKGDSNEWSDSK